MDKNEISHIEDDIIIHQLVYAWFKEIKNDNECLIHLVPRLLPQNDLLDMLPLFLFKWKDMKLSLNEFYLFFFSLSRVFFFSFTWISMTWDISFVLQITWWFHLNEFVFSSLSLSFKSNYIFLFLLNI
jgi:hypothetical protein